VRAVAAGLFLPRGGGGGGGGGCYQCSGDPYETAATPGRLFFLLQKRWTVGQRGAVYAKGTRLDGGVRRPCRTQL